MENVRGRLKVEFIKKDDNERITKLQSKIHSMVLIYPIQIMIAIHSSKMKF